MAYASVAVISKKMVFDWWRANPETSGNITRNIGTFFRDYSYWPLSCKDIVSNFSIVLWLFHTILFVTQSESKNYFFEVKHI